MSTTSQGNLLDQLKLLSCHIQSHQIALGGLNLVTISERVPQLQQHLTSLQQLQALTNAHIASLNNNSSNNVPVTSIAALLNPPTPTTSATSTIPLPSAATPKPVPSPSAPTIPSAAIRKPVPSTPPPTTSKPVPTPLPATSKPAPTTILVTPTSPTLPSTPTPLITPTLTRTTSAPLSTRMPPTPTTPTTATTITTSTSPPTPARTSTTTTTPLLVPVPVPISSSPATPTTPARGRKRAIAASESALDTPAKKKAASKTPVEARMSPYKKRSNQGVRDRIARAAVEKLWVVNREIEVSTAEERALELQRHCEYSVPKQKFVIMGSTGNLYNVTIYYKPACTCPDFLKGNLCKHILFVYLKVLKVPSTSELIFQTALTSSELTQIFTNAPVDASLLADKKVRTEYTQLVNPSAPKDAPNTPKQRPIEGDCPVCFDAMNSKEQIEFCKECGNNVHKTCWEKWSMTKRSSKIPETCIYCRAPWNGADRAAAGKAAVINEGYLNLANLQPRTSIERDYDPHTYGGGYGYGGGGYRYGRGRNFIDLEHE